ncbi:hypothetical protein [Frankia sp. ACN1ag]|nr:hypothetical protein [Frankia sp. ACN1ag]
MTSAAAVEVARGAGNAVWRGVGVGVRATPRAARTEITVAAVDV